MNTTLVRPALAALCRIVLGAGLAIGLASGTSAFAHGGGGGGGGGGGHGGGGFGGGFGGGHMGGGGFGFGGGHMGGLGFGGGRMGGGYYGRGGYGYGGFYPGFFGLGLGYGLGYGWGAVRLRLSGIWLWPGLRLRLSGIWLWPGILRLRLSGYGYGYGSGYYDPYYGYGTAYVDPGVSNLVNSNVSPGYTYSSAYGTVPFQARTSAAPSSFALPSLGIDEKAVSDAKGNHIEVAGVHPGSPAERVGLKPGDTIVSANGYLTQTPGNLAWIINHHASSGAVTLHIRKAANGQEATVNATLH